MTGDDAIAAAPLPETAESVHSPEIGESVPTPEMGESVPLPEMAEPASETPPADLRSQLIAQFERWVDQMLVDEAPPRGVPDHLLSEAAAMVTGNQPARETDLYNLFASLTSLTGEIRLQGRAFKQLTDLLSPLAETPAMLAQLHEAQIESVASIQAALIDQNNDADALPVEFKQVCDVMIDLYDRLRRGLQTCDDGIQSLQARAKNGWLRRLVRARHVAEHAASSVEAIRDASAMTLARLGAALQEWGVQRIGEVGDSFDADRMTAVDVRATDEAEPGTVLVVNRSGYALNGTLKATARVTVSKAEL